MTTSSASWKATWAAASSARRRCLLMVARLLAPGDLDVVRDPATGALYIKDEILIKKPASMTAEAFEKKIRSLGAKIIEQDMADVRALNVQKTPGYFVNGKPLQTFGYKQLYQLIQSELDEQYPK